MSIQLHPSHLKEIKVPGPRYDRASHKHGIVHLGVGGFHRAHQAVYLDELLSRAGHGDWGLCGVGILPQDKHMAEVMAEQECLYTVVERSSAGDQARIIGSMTSYLFAPENPEAVLEKMAHPDCRIVSLTITEGGYSVHQGTGEFDPTPADIQWDLAHPHRPKGAYGFIAEALERRKARGLKPFTLLSCDNLQGNGEVLKKMFLAFAGLRDPGLRDWVAQFGAFPSSMVDRITPATKDEHRQLVKEKFGIVDGWPVVCEPFRQWVIEDHFPLGRPAWETVGAQMTHDVMPYEKMKIRLLNASHQALCYIGMLLGYEFAHQTMEDPRIQRLVRTMMDDEVTPLLPPVPGVSLEAYKATLIERFANPTIRDQLARIGTEGSARIPKFVLPSVRDQLTAGGPIRLHAFTVAAWFRYLTGTDDQGRALPLIDPQGAALKAVAQKGQADPSPMLGQAQLFGTDLPASNRFVVEVKKALEALYKLGAEKALEQYVGGKS